jgi:DNA-binding transcriptional ArsR family regulator
MKRQPRNTRKPNVKVKLSDRDYLILSALARFGIARTGELLTLAFSGVRSDTASRRLRALFDAGYLEPQVFELSKENVYRLGPAGRRWAAEHGLPVFKRPRISINHHLAVVQAWVELARACHELPGCALVRVIPEWELRTLPETAAYPLIPDALVELSVYQDQGNTLVRMALEVDLETEGLSVLRRKVGHYSRFLGTTESLWSWTEFSLMFAVSGWTENRKRKFQEFLEGSWLGSWILWDQEAGPTHALIRLAEEIQAPLTTSPYGKGSLSALSD